jgi:hypothetical protein
MSGRFGRAVFPLSLRQLKRRLCVGAIPASALMLSKMLHETDDRKQVPKKAVYWKHDLFTKGVPPGFSLGELPGLPV